MTCELLSLVLSIFAIEIKVNISLVQKMCIINGKYKLLDIYRVRKKCCQKKQFLLDQFSFKLISILSIGSQGEGYYRGVPPNRVTFYINVPYNRVLL